MSRWQVRVSGRVQGVGFRAASQSQAQRLGLTGWVRNRRDGSVELQLDGPPPALAAMREWLRHGPPAARVEQVDVVAAGIGDARSAGFELRPTA